MPFQQLTATLWVLALCCSHAVKNEVCIDSSSESHQPASALLQKQIQTDKGLASVQQHAWGVPAASNEQSSLLSNQDRKVLRAALHHLDDQPSLAMEKGLSLASSSEESALQKHKHQEVKHEENVFRWGTDAEELHPRTIGKKAPHRTVINYEAQLEPLTGMVLNIFSNASSGSGGLLLALEVQSACSSKDSWIEVSRARCSVHYPCALRLPAVAVTGSSNTPTSFRTKVILGDEDYSTDFIEYQKVSLDKESEVVVAHEKFEDHSSKRILKFNLSPAQAAGALYVMPIVKDGTSDAKITMRLRQPEPKQSALQEDQMLQDGSEVDAGPSSTSNLQKALQSYRREWAGDWREPVDVINSCDLSMFEVVADQLYPGEVELEVFMANSSGSASNTISDVLVTTRVSWAQAEISLLDYALKEHFAYFNDPEVVIHGLPVGAYKEGHPDEYPVSNPTEWGYCMQAWVLQVETGVMKAEEAVAKLNETFTTLETLQNDPNQFKMTSENAGMFYPLYNLRSKSGEKIFPTRLLDAPELPCGDDALLYSSMLMVQGWLIANDFKKEADFADRILAKADFSQCLRVTDCNEVMNGQNTKNEDPNVEGDKFWSIPLTVNADTMEKNSWNWNVWADEGGLVAMIISMTGAVEKDQYEDLVREQQKYSPCQYWEGISVGHAAFFNSVFTLPTRSMLGFGTLFSTPYLHEFALRTVLPTFRAHQKLKSKLGADYMGPSDAMTQALRSSGEQVFGSYAYWPPNNHYDCRLQKSIRENQCTWCDGVQAGGHDDPFDMVVPHGSMAAFLAMGMMEISQFSKWIEDTKQLMTDASGVYKRGYGMEVMAPARRTPEGGDFPGANKGRGIWESLSYGYTILSMYEGLASMRRRFELAEPKAGDFVKQGFSEPPKYRPLSDFFDHVPEKRAIIDSLMNIAQSQESKEKTCHPSNYGPPGRY